MDAVLRIRDDLVRSAEPDGVVTRVPGLMSSLCTRSVPRIGITLSFAARERYLVAMNRPGIRRKISEGLRIARARQCGALLVLLVLLPLQARADSIESRERAARMACLSGDYRKGVAILSELFVDTKDKTYLYNQGRCFEQNGRYEEAILRFREYLRKNRDTGGAPDADAERHIADCQALQAKEKAKDRDGTAPPPAAAPTAATQPQAVVQVPAKTQNQGAGLRIAGITTAAVGVAALATGLILNLKANSIADELESTTDNYQRSKESTRRSYRTFGWVSYGIGAAGAVGGTILYLVGRRRGHEAAIALWPSVGPDAAGAVLQGAF